jgi:phosphatidylglycerol:prolipoprotein diacylglycerol transferase
MKPTLSGWPSYYVLWTLAALLGTLLNYRLLRERGLPGLRVLILLAVTGVTAVAGAKLEHALENGLPATEFLATPGLRMPGGLVAMSVTLVLLCRALGLPLLAVLDGIAPGILVAIVVGRLGCFLNGCCFGIPTQLPWGVRFPAGSPAHASQQVQGLLAASATESLAVHPLSLYFALDALLIVVVLMALRRRAAYAGQVFLWFLVLRCWSKVVLERLRGYELGSSVNQSGQVELVVAVLATATLIVVSIARARRVPPQAPAGAVPHRASASSNRYSTGC